MQVCLLAFVCLLLLYPSGSECQSNATDGLAPTDVSFEQMSVPQRAWAGEEVEVNVRLRNLGADEAEVQARWQTSAITAVLERGQTELTIPAGQTSEACSVIHAPSVRRRCELVCQAVVTTEVSRDQGSCQVSVFPPWETTSLAIILSGRRIGLVDFDGALGSLLEETSVACLDLSSPVAVRHFSGELILVVASDRLATQPLLHRKLVQAAENGARLLWLGEGHPGAASIPDSLVHWVRSGTHHGSVSPKP